MQVSVLENLEIRTVITKKKIKENKYFRKINCRTIESRNHQKNKVPLSSSSMAVLC